MHHTIRTAFLFVASAATAFSQSFTTDSSGLTLLDAANRATRVEIWKDGVIRVVHAPGATVPTISSLAVTAAPATVSWQHQDLGDSLRITTPSLRVDLRKTDGRVEFANLAGDSLLSETAGGSSLTPVTLNTLNGNSEASHIAAQRFALSSGEALTGLGQFYNDPAINRVGQTKVLRQENTEAVVPVLLSSKGYLLLWDNPAITTVDVGNSNPNEVRWSSEAGDAVNYYFCHGPLPDQAVAGYRFLTGAAPLFGKWFYGFWQCRERYTNQAQVIGVVDQYQSMGVPIDGIIQDWQYWPDLNQANATGGWGSHEFDATRFPDPQGMMDELHAKGVKLIISVWPKFDVTGSGNSIANLQALEAVGGALSPVIPYVSPAGQGKWLDPFSAAGRQVYWQKISERLFSKGVDGWWLDGSEPELSGNWGEFRTYDTALGAGAKVHNAYSLMQTKAVYDGQRAENSNKRVFILTRSGYTGQQRHGAVTWSGDIVGSWDVLAKQIPAGLSFSASGIPYWNTDIGGFFAGQPADPAYAELFTRWFQYGAFCPMFRVHGSTGTNDAYAKEIWRFPAATQPVLIDFVKLRYHLMPYIYSTAWKVTNEGYTMMRPLLMDFPGDAASHGVNNQFLFGPGIMVSPVTQPAATSRSVYLPSDTTWIDFWTGVPESGGQSTQASAPIGRMPLHVRTGTILPYGPEVANAMVHPETIELRVYQGADGSFTLYEDQGDTYQYETGVHATIPFIWNDTTRQLTIGARTGSFPGMLANRTFKVVFVSPGHGEGISNETTPDAVVNYDGTAVVVNAPALPPLPAVPAGVAAIAETAGVRLSWNPAGDGVLHRIRRAVQPGGPYTTVAPVVEGNTWVDTSVEPGTAYHYVISALNAAGESPMSAEVSAIFGSAALRHLWMFNEATGNHAADGSGRGAHAFLVNGPGRVTGKGGQALDLDGSDDHATLPAGLLSNLNHCSFACWVKPDAATSGAPVFEYSNGGDTWLSLNLPSVTGGPRFSLTTSGTGGAQNIGSSTPLPAGTWTHLAVTLAGNTGILYVNGLEAARNDALTLSPVQLGALSQAFVGRSANATSAYFDGGIDDLRIYSGALSAAQVQAIATGTAGALAAPWTSQDIGGPAIPGSSGNSTSTTLHLTASGSDIQNTGDQFHFAWQTKSGDHEIIARVDAMDASDPWAKAGVMMRATTDAGAVNCLLAVTPLNGVTFQSRDSTGGGTTWSQNAGLAAPQWLKISRTGQTFIAYRSADGVAWQQTDSVNLPNMPETILTGLAVTSHTNSAPVGVSISNVALSGPPPSVPVTSSLTLPIPDADDFSFLEQNFNDADNIGGSGISSSADNDESTYVAPDRSSKGQSFTTGNHPYGYQLQSFTFQHVLWPDFLNNGTYYDVRPGDTFRIQLSKLEGTVKSVIHSGTANYQGAAITGGGNLGTGTFLTFDFQGSGIPALEPATTYAFEIAPLSGDPYFELNGSRSGNYTSGTALRGNAGGEAGTIGTAVNLLEGDRVFHASLTALPPPDYSQWIGGFPGIGSAIGMTDDPDGDGLKNAVENVFGTNPGASNQGITQIAESGNILTFVHPLNPYPAPDLETSYEWSIDLVHYYADGISAGGTSVSFSTGVRNEETGLVAISATVEGIKPPRLFVRLMARSR